MADIGAEGGGFERLFADFLVEEVEGAVAHVMRRFEVDGVRGEDEADEDGVRFGGAHLAWVRVVGRSSWYRSWDYVYESSIDISGLDPPLSLDICIQSVICAIFER